MALIAHSELPAFERMRTEGASVAAPLDVIDSARPRITVALLNLMPDAALRATDRQFIRLIAAYGEDADLWVYPFTVAGEHRGEGARDYVATHYQTFESLQDEPVDALIVTGANPAEDRLANEVFWDDMMEVLGWAKANVHSVVCSCLATHAVLEEYSSIDRMLLPEKRWGVYSHRVLRAHPLLEGVKTAVDAPHSHRYEVTTEQIVSAGGVVLIESDEAGAHMAVSSDDFYVFFQGHPEYDGVSLLKEYKREVGRFYSDERSDYPPFPEHYFDASARTRLLRYQADLEAAKAKSSQPGPFPADDSLGHHANTWTGVGRVIYGNWLRGVLESRMGSTLQTR